MPKLRVILRADANKNIGFGHFVRLLGLAQWLSEYFECYFCSYNADSQTGELTEFQCSELAGICGLLPISAGSIDEFNNKFLAEIRLSDCVVLDNYYFTTDFQQIIKSKAHALVCIDDMHVHHFVSDAVITCCPLTKDEFSLEDYTKFLGGLKYSFLREPFYKDVAQKPHRTCLKHFVIAMGGSDPFGLSIKILKMLINIVDELQVKIIAGESVKFDIGDFQNKDTIKIVRHLSANQIADLFAWADMGIFSASTTSIEALSCKLPVAAGWYVDNQKELYKYGVEHGLFHPLGYLLDDSTNIAERLKTVIDNRVNLSPNGIHFQEGRQEVIDLFLSL